MLLKLPSGLRAAIACGLVASCAPSVDEAGTPTRIVRQIEALLGDVAANELARDPEQATRLGLRDETLAYPFQTYLTDRSQAAYERMRVRRLETLEQLRKAPAATPGSTLARDVAVVIDAYEAATRLGAFGHGQADLGLAYPFVIDHMRGAYIDVPALLTRDHPGRSKADVEAYILRLRQLPDAIDDERRRLFADAAAGIIPPEFILIEMAETADALSDGPGEDHPLMVALTNLMTGPEDLTGDDRAALAAEGLAVITEDVLPAYLRLQAALNALKIRAPYEPGVWQLPEGGDYYSAVLEAYTEPGADAGALHDLGRAEVRALTEALDVALVEAGLPDGTVGERLAALSALPEQAWPEDAEASAGLVAELDTYLSAAAAVTPRLVETPPRTPVTIQAVPGFLEASSPAASYRAAPANGTAPGVFSLNMSDTAGWPRFTLPTLVYHETVPGHHLESAIAAEQARLPLIRQLVWNTAYGEGWAVYGEDLADEMGLYDEDPLGRIGYLQSLLFRAARLVVDTGIHHKRWSREEAANYLVDTTGQDEAAMLKEVDRYAVWPGQAAAYWVGRKKMRDLRERSERVLGPDFDLAAFHQAVLTGGPRPLSLLEKDIERWYGAQIAPDR